MRLAGKIATVTGAFGFGAGIARRFAEEGARIACVDVRREAAEGGAAGALFLASDEAGSVTGSGLPVDGGRIA